MNCITGKPHVYFTPPQETRVECKTCGLLRSTIEQTHPKQSTELEEILRECQNLYFMLSGVTHAESEWLKFSEKCYHSGHTAGLEQAEADNLRTLPELLEAAKAAERAKIEQNIGLLRQWLNEKPEGLVTNENIERFLNLKD